MLLRKPLCQSPTRCRMPVWLSRDWHWGLILVLAVVAGLSTVWWAGYIWDDDIYITNNPLLFGLHGLRKSGTTNAADISPLTFTTFLAGARTVGTGPVAYHLVNVLLHGACAVCALAGVAEFAGAGRVVRSGALASTL